MEALDSMWGNISEGVPLFPVNRVISECRLDAIKGGPVRNALNVPSSAGAMPPLVGRYADLAHRVGVLLSTIAPGNIRGSR